MRRSTLVVGILALFLTSLVVTALAEARAGGGFSGGSRGSRSYSAPRSPAPSSPMTPSSPTSPQRSLSPTQPQRPGGFLGGWGGMLGGFLLGGLLGGLLFGGLGQGLGGFGLMDILLVGGLIWLAVAFFRRRQPQPAYAGAPGRAEWAPAETAAPESMATAIPVGAVDEDLDRGIAAIRAMDAGFTPLRFAGVARDMFLRVQSAWSAGDLGPVRAELTDEMAGSLEADLARLKGLRRVNRLDKVTVESAEPTETWQEYGKDFVTVRFRASALDYTLDEATGAVVEGSNSVPTGFEEYWTFTRPVGPNPWRLSAIQQPS
ncbi:MAG: Tim44 domain-containing protein [Candidatus Rokubacteria bacterium]|nr:Tim44 domain-containing protein [Candidatus Rokubacteria bacterium]